MFKSILIKLRIFFSKKKSKAIPFSDLSREKVRSRSFFEKKESTSKKPPEQDRQSDPLQKTRPVAQQKPAPPKKKAPPKPRWTIEQFDVPPEEGKIRFHDLAIPMKLMRAIHQLGFKYCTPIQGETLPQTLQQRDTIAQAQTGTGKTAAFLIAIISQFIKNPVKGGPAKGFPRALILAPTRELALQIEKDAQNLIKFTPFNVMAVFGGIGYEKQKTRLETQSFDIIVATPGRLIDYINKRLLNLSKVEVLVIDEADRMLDMGFIPDIRKIVYKTPHKDKRQTLFYSATYTDDVSSLANQWTKNAFVVTNQAENITADTIQQKIFLVTAHEKFTILFNIIQKAGKDDKILIFTNRRDQTRDLSEKLNRYEFKTEILSGEVHQSKRMKALENFKKGDTRILVATDVAARGIHIDGISHVINYNIPNDPEHYVHRIGRTGRAGASGISISFACEDESFYIPAIEDVLGSKFDCEHPGDELLIPVPKPTLPPPKKTIQKKTGYQKNSGSNKSAGSQKSHRPGKYKKRYENSNRQKQ